MSNEENEKNIKTEQVLQNDRVKKPFNKKILIVVIIGIFLLLIFGIIVFSSNSNTEYIDGDKIDVSKIKLSLSSDYKYFNNSITDFAAVIINDFNSNSVTVKSHSNCSSNDFNTTYCYNIILNNNDKLYILSNSNENFEKIIFNGKLQDTKYTGKVLGTIARLYLSASTEFENEINANFLSDENLEKEIGLNYVYSHMKFEWTRDDSKGEYTIIFSVSESENQEQYEQTEDYKNNYISSLKTTAYNKVKKQVSSYHTIDEYEINSQTNLVDIKIKYEKSDLSKYVCASDTQSFVKQLVGEKTIGTIQFECINDSGTFYYVKVENVNSITSDKINDNTKYFNSNYSSENTNLDKLKELVVTDYKKSCANYNYKQVLRNPSEYEGKKAYWFGEILQVVDKTSFYSTFRVGVSCTKYQYIGGYSCPDTLYVTYYGSESFIEDDMVKMYGTMDGTQTYTTVMGASVTVPKFNATYIDLQ